MRRGRARAPTSGDVIEAGVEPPGATVSDVSGGGSRSASQSASARSSAVQSSPNRSPSAPQRRAVWGGRPVRHRFSSRNRTSIRADRSEPAGSPPRVTKYTAFRSWSIESRRPDCWRLRTRSMSWSVVPSPPSFSQVGGDDRFEPLLARVPHLEPQAPAEEGRRQLALAVAGQDDERELPAAYPPTFHRRAIRLRGRRCERSLCPPPRSESVRGCRTRPPPGR